jgi:hypothetical protein
MMVGLRGKSDRCQRREFHVSGSAEMCNRDSPAGTVLVTVLRWARKSREKTLLGASQKATARSRQSARPPNSTEATAMRIEAGRIRGGTRRRHLRDGFLRTSATSVGDPNGLSKIYGVARFE